MTAIGFLLMIIGMLLMTFNDRLSRAEVAGVWIFGLGSLLATVGIIVWLWRVMP